MTYEEALHKTAAFCSLQERCVSEVLDKLSKMEISESDSHKIIAYLTQEKFIDESRFAVAFAKDKFRFNKWGKIKIKMGLKEKGIHPNQIEEALNEIDEKAYEELAVELINSKSKTLKYKNEFDRKGKLVRYMLQKGFETSIVFRLIQVDSQNF